MTEISTTTLIAREDLTGAELVPIKSGSDFDHVELGFAARYWMLRNLSSPLSRSNGNSNVTVAEFILKTAGSPLTVSSVSASTSYDGGSGPQYAVDGDTSTNWSNSSGDSDARSFYIFDMGSAVSPDQLSVVSREGSFYGQTPNRFDVLYSFDGITYNPLCLVMFPDFTGPTQTQTAALPVVW